MHNLKGKAVRGGLAKALGQVATMAVRLFYLGIAARLLSPNDFGLVAMVTVVTGFFDLFTSAGLSLATVQKSNITNQQISQLFWINILVGGLLALLCVVGAPFIAEFYRDPRLLWIMIALAPGFLFAASGVQHSALLQRDLRYPALSAIEALSHLGGAFLGIFLALAGYGYWALVGGLIATSAINTIGCWACTGWVPERPRMGVEVWPLLSFGGIVTLNGIVVYIAYNMEKIILGRFWGADVLGIYTRAVQLIGLPVNTMNATVGGIFFSTLSRLQNDPVQFRGFFLKGYRLVMAVTVPATLLCALFADEIITLILGPGWPEAIPIFRLMTPTILVFGIINPLFWVMVSMGLQKRSLYVGLVLAPLVVVAYMLGMPYGPNGVALGYSTIMVLWLFPHVAWCLHGTPISIADLSRAVAGPLAAGIVAAACSFTLLHQFGQELSAALRLAIGGVTMALVYGWILLFVMGYRSLLVSVLVALGQPSQLEA